MTGVRRRSYLKAVGTVPIVGAVAGCLGSSGRSGTLATQVWDQPGDIGDFETLLIQAYGIRVKPKDEYPKQFETDVEVDLTELVGEASEHIDQKELATGTYEFLQLDAEAAEAARNGGDSATVDLPGDAPLKFNKEFKVRSDQTTSFPIDVTSVKEGQTGRYLLQLMAKEVVVCHQDT